MSEVNVPLLRKAVEWAETESQKPKELSEWYQGAWCSEPGKYSEFVENNAFYQKAEDCGTCYCIAGYVVSLTLAKGESMGGALIYSEDHWDEGDFEESVAERAEKVLGLPSVGPARYQPLFHAKNSIEDIRRIAEELAGEKL